MDVQETSSARRPRFRERPGSVAFTIVLAILSACSEPEPTREPAPPIVVLVSIDTLRADHLGAYGYGRDTSPVLDGLAADGVLFERATASSSWTLPSHAALFTGVADSIHGVVDPSLTLGPALPTLAERFREAGFETGAVVSSPFLHPGYGFGRGFDEYLNCMGFLDDSFGAPDGEPVRLREMHARSHSDVTSPCVVERAKEWIEAHSSKPSFLFLHFWDVHYDFLPPPPFDTAFDPEYEGTLDPTDFEANPALTADMDSRDLEHLVALYDGEIAYVDAMVGDFLDSLEDAGLTERLLVAVTSDHGEAFFEHGRKGHRTDLHVETTRVPLIFWGRGVPEGERVAAPVHLVDVMPTLLHLVTDSAPGSLERGQGRIVLGPGTATSADRWVVSELRSGDLDQIAIESAERKVILDRRAGTVVAYDLETDAAEQRPLEPTREDLRELRATLATLDAAAARATAVPMDGMTPELQERLRALGYVE